MADLIRSMEDDLQEQYEWEDTAVACPACDGPNHVAGKLGNLDHYHCQYCGAWYTHG